MKASKLFMVFSIIVTGLVVGLVFYGAHNADKQKIVICLSEQEDATNDQKLGSIEMFGLLVDVGKKAACFKNQPVFTNKY